MQLRKAFRSLRIRLANIGSAERYMQDPAVREIAVITGFQPQEFKTERTIQGEDQGVLVGTWTPPEGWQGQGSPQEASYYKWIDPQLKRSEFLDLEVELDSPSVGLMSLKGLPPDVEQYAQFD